MVAPLDRRTEPRKRVVDIPAKSNESHYLGPVQEDASQEERVGISS